MSSTVSPMKALMQTGAAEKAFLFSYFCLHKSINFTFFSWISSPDVIGNIIGLRDIFAATPEKFHKNHGFLASCRRSVKSIHWKQMDPQPRQKSCRHASPRAGLCARPKVEPAQLLPAVRSTLQRCRWGWCKMWRFNRQKWGHNMI